MIEPIERRRRKKEGGGGGTRGGGVFLSFFIPGRISPSCRGKYIRVLVSKESRESRRGGPRIVRPARGDNLQKTTEMDWRSMLFSPIEKFPVRERFTRYPFFLFFSLIYLWTRSKDVSPVNFNNTIVCVRSRNARLSTTFVIINFDRVVWRRIVNLYSFFFKRFSTYKVKIHSISILQEIYEA